MNDAGTRMWFAQDGMDFVAYLSPMGVTHIEKATFGQGPIFNAPKGPSEKPTISYNPADVHQEEEPERRDNANL